MRKINLYDKSKYIEKLNGDINEGESNPLNKRKKDKTILNNWLLISFLLSLLSSLILGYVFNSINIGLIAFLITFIMMFFLNPTRRFFRTASALLLLGIGIIPSISFNLLIPENKFGLTGEFSFGGFGGYIMSCVIICLAGYLFYLDSRKN